MDTDMDVDELSAGLSRLLLKGERRVLKENGLARITISSSWGWAKKLDEVNSVRYLDVSCLVFGADHGFVEPIDYDHRISTEAVGKQGAVQHSGDILSGHQCLGRQSVAINLSLLSPRVTELFVIMSVWLGSKLEDITQPVVSMVDRDSCQALCEYRLEEQPPDALAAHSSIIMCRVYSNCGRWEVEAVGQLGQGAADNYSPILASIQHSRGLLDALQGWTM